MSQLFTCPYLGSDVELTDEWEQHIAVTHPETLPDYLEQLRETIEDPDQIRQSERDENALLFSKWFDSIRTGRYLVVVIVASFDPVRYCVVTTYIARKLTGGSVV